LGLNKNPDGKIFEQTFEGFESQNSGSI